MYFNFNFWILIYLEYYNPIFDTFKLRFGKLCKFISKELSYFWWEFMTQLMYVVIGKAPTNFFNCSSSWPSLAGLFPLLSPGIYEAFVSIVGMSRTRNLMNGPAQYITNSHIWKHTYYCWKYINKWNFLGLLSLIGNNSLFIYILTVLLHEFIHI